MRKTYAWTHTWPSDMSVGILTVASVSPLTLTCSLEMLSMAIFCWDSRLGTVREKLNSTQAMIALLTSREAHTIEVLRYSVWNYYTISVFCEGKTSIIHWNGFSEWCVEGTFMPCFNLRSVGLDYLELLLLTFSCWSSAFLLMLLPTKNRDWIFWIVASVLILCENF